MLSTGAIAEPVVTVRPPQEVGLEAGQSREVAVEIDVKGGFHVQANPAANEFLVPLVVAIEPADELTVGEPRYPPASRLRLKGTEEDLLVYDGTIAVSVPIQTTATAAAGARKLEGSMRFQACDKVSCRPPATAAFELAVRILPKRRGQ